MNKHVKKKRSRFDKLAKLLYFAFLLCLMATFIPLFIVQDEEGVVAYVNNEQLQEHEAYSLALKSLEKISETETINSVEDIRYMLFDNLEKDYYRKDVMIKYTTAAGSSTKYFRICYVTKQVPNYMGYGYNTVTELDFVPIEKNDYMDTKKMTYLSQISPEPFGFKIREYAYDTKSVKAIFAEVNS